MRLSWRIRDSAINKRQIGTSANCSVGILSGNLVVLETIEEAQALAGGMIDSDDLLAKLGNVYVREIQLQVGNVSWIRNVVPDPADVLLGDVTDWRNTRDWSAGRQNLSAVSRA